jgi:NADH-quinone oxidoreductase subunit I
MALLSIIQETGEYFKDIFKGVASLIRGMKVTGGYFIRSRDIVTQQYPKNRAQLKMFDNFKGVLEMIHDENNQHSCTACGNCERRCPNGSIEILSSRVQGEDGRSKRVLDKYTYHLDMCTFCGLCVPACEEKAIRFGQKFEHAVFNKTKLTMILNKPGSTSKLKPV